MLFLGYVHAETDRALLFQDHFWHHPEWMPKSQSTIRKSETSIEVQIDATGWICGKKDLREFEERTEAPDGP